MDGSDERREKNREVLKHANIRRFLIFRVFFNSRFYYPIFAILFLDFGLSLNHFALLNVIWAATIVLLEVPSGALADIVGRKKLLVFAGAVMVVEIAVLCFAPRGNLTLLFTLFAVNRVLSGAAEAAASGADQALAYDTLVAAGQEDSWGEVLETVMRYQAIGFMAAMSIGAAVYDPHLLNRAFQAVGLDLGISQDATLRLPLFLTLLGALVAFFAALGLEEISPDGEEVCVDLANCGRSVSEAFGLTLEAGRWILKTPFALMVIVAGFMFDHVIRLLLTLDSQYFRTIDLPEASFGLIGSVLAAMGMIIPRLARRLAERRTPTFNMLVQAVATAAGLLGLSLFMPIVGILPMAVLVAVWSSNEFFVSRYLNEVTSSGRRATVLSFKGLSFNLAYGLIGLEYSALLAWLHSRVGQGLGAAGEEAVFMQSIGALPLYFFVVFVACLAVGAWLLRGGRGLEKARPEKNPATD